MDIIFYMKKTLLTIFLLLLSMKIFSQIDAGDNVTIYPGEYAQLMANGNCSYFTWFPTNGLNYSDIKNPIANPSVTTRYYVFGKTDNGESFNDSVDVIVLNNNIIDIPNAFAPSNNIFKIISKGNFQLDLFTIYNRYGKVMFSTSDVNSGWDGSYNGVPQPIGIYVFTIKGKGFFKQGSFLLAR